MLKLAFAFLSAAKPAAGRLIAIQMTTIRKTVIPFVAGMIYAGIFLSKSQTILRKNGVYRIET